MVALSKSVQPADCNRWQMAHLLGFSSSMLATAFCAAGKRQLRSKPLSPSTGRIGFFPTRFAKNFSRWRTTDLSREQLPFTGLI